MTPAVSAQTLGKSFGAVEAVSRVDLEVAPGEIYGFLGRNGAGKTTTIRMLLGMVRPTRGTISLLGQPVSQGRGPWHRVGSLVESAVAWPDLSVRDNLRVLAAYHGLDRGRRVDSLIEEWDLDAYADRRAGTLSLGNLQKLALAFAWLPQPDLFILDEPTNGLDPAAVVLVRAHIAAAAARGAAVLVSSHQLDEVARTAHRVGVLDHGTLVAEFSAQSADRRILVVDTAHLDLARELLVRGGIPEADLQWRFEGLEAAFLRLTGETS